MPDVLRQKLKYSHYALLKTAWKYQTRKFFENSTLHGVRYIAEKDRPVYEKLMWFAFVSVGAIVTLIIIASLWEKFQTNPTITGLDTDFHSWDVPFPGITICPSNPASPERVDEYIKNKWGDDIPEEKTEYYRKFVNAMTNFTYMTLNTINQFKDDKELPQTGFRQMMLDVALRCEDFLNECTFKGDGVPCCEAFRPTFTEKGFCYSFNSFHAESNWPWKQSNGNVKSQKTHHIFETDETWSFKFDANIEQVNVSVLNVFIHEGKEMLGTDTPSQHVWNNQIDQIFFAARTTYTTANARQLSIKQRKCVFKDEIKLKTAAEYSFWACMSDCRMKLAFEKCACVAFFHHAIPGFPYCDIEGLVCLSKYAEKLIIGADCHCELGCDNTIYEVEKLNDGQQENFNLEIGFVSWPMIRYKREVLFGWVDLLVAFGGIAGLFLGFSLLSGVEIIYYFTLRASCMVYRNKNELEELKYEEETLPSPRINLGLALDFTHLTEIGTNAISLQKASEKSSFVSRILVPGEGKKENAKLRKYPTHTIPFMH